MNHPLLAFEYRLELSQLLTAKIADDIRGQDRLFSAQEAPAVSTQSEDAAQQEGLLSDAPETLCDLEQGMITQSVLNPALTKPGPKDATPGGSSGS